MSSPTRLVFLSFLSTFLSTCAVAFLIPVFKAMTGSTSEPAANSQRVTSTRGVSEVPPSHLIVLVHGLGGTPEDLTYLKKGLERRGGGDGVLVHLARCNKGKTKDGVAKGGSRLADEIRQVVKSNPSLTRISLVGNSLGGLYIRYAAKLLYRDQGDGDDARDAQQLTNGVGDGETGNSRNLADPTTTTPFGNGPNASSAPSSSSTPSIIREGETPAPEGGTPRGTVAGLEPSVFMTIASPHLGVRSFTYVPVPSSLHPLAGGLVGKTGSDLFMSSSSESSSSRRIISGGTANPGMAESVDGNSGRSSLLYDMATAEQYLTPLKAFRRRRAYANRRGDFMVPYGTAAFVGPNEGDGGNLLDTDGLSTFDRVWGAKEGTIVGLSRIPASSPAGTGDEQIVGGGRRQATGGFGAESGRWGRRSGKKADIMSVEEEMAAGLNSCGWEKVAVDFGGVVPFSHNKICALSRSPLTTALFCSGNKIMDNAADFLVAQDFQDGHGG